MIAEMKRIKLSKKAQDAFYASYREDIAPVIKMIRAEQIRAQQSSIGVVLD